MTKTALRAVRLIQIQHLIYRNPLGITAFELAELYGTGIRTIQRDLLILQTELNFPIIKKGYDRYGLPDGYFLPPISLSLYEAVGLFLAARLVIKQTDERNPHIESALERLCSILPLSVAKQLQQGIQYLSNKKANTEYLRTFEKAAIAWSTRRCLKFKYRSLKSSKEKDWIIAPYFIEITGTSYSTYILGKVIKGEREGIITFKLDRMSDVRLLEESFEIPEGLKLDELLSSSWGVMWGEETEVKLRFSPQVTRRVKESIWHISQTIEDLPDGGCIMTVRVGSVLEMTPWIRGWGVDVEVLQPDSLRNEFKIWAKEMDRMYNRNEEVR
jgi:predicted DNA-binding transcriptional regulator YafY